MPEAFTRDDAKITVLVNGLRYEGWLQSEVERSIETISGTFSVPIDYDPDNPPNVKRQDEVQILIGDAPVATGYVLAAEPFARRSAVGLRIIGHDRTGDLVHCAALHQGGQWRGAKLDVIVKDLLRPFGIDLVVDADLGLPIPDFRLGHGETMLDALSRAARLRGVLVTRDDLGRLVLTKAGKRKFKGAIVSGPGGNVISVEGIGSHEKRFSEYRVYAQGSPLQGFDSARHLVAIAKDDQVKRYRPLIISADGNTTQAELQALADHTMRVRRGHSMGFRYTVEGWTFKGSPWPLNERVPVHCKVAGLDGAEWLICSVKQTVDRQAGDVTEIVVRPIEAYDTVPLKSKIKRHHMSDMRRSGTSVEVKSPGSVYDSY